jgi:hypothetical protein
MEKIDYNEDLHNLHPSINIRVIKLGRPRRSIHGRYEKYVQNFSWKTLREHMRPKCKWNFVKIGVWGQYGSYEHIDGPSAL